ncbi:MAG: hypothetical protein OHK93_008567 [Ramalina farinacea]|uniref:Uncharacterized protein n=1 Tax=Ramalina farinacea TaxID=258253 RepID=A0AA43QPR0_9LECA|nr:hypothetical protein [Ramalina farinacea]
MPSAHTPTQKAAIAQFVGFTQVKDSVAAKTVFLALAMGLIWAPRWLKKWPTLPKARSEHVNSPSESVNNASENPLTPSENPFSLSENTFTLSGGPTHLSEHSPTLPRYFHSNSSSSSGASTASTTTLNKIFDKYKGKLTPMDI